MHWTKFDIKLGFNSPFKVCLSLHFRFEVLQQCNFMFFCLSFLFSKGARPLLSCKVGYMLSLEGKCNLITQNFHHFHGPGPSLWCKVGYMLSLEGKCNLITQNFHHFHGPGPSLWCKVVLILSMDRPCNLPTYEDTFRNCSHGLNFLKKKLSLISILLYPRYISGKFNLCLKMLVIVIVGLVYRDWASI